jgi:hypothetical protein
MRFLAEAGLEANNYSISLKLCFCLAVDAIIEASEEISSEAAFL